uniref:Potassium channel domain-containing protein n=1 Tax=Macrostomum lignano TaxID=282301 RepID=A0A1I8HDA3_9PLAT
MATQNSTISHGFLSRLRRQGMPTRMPPQQAGRRDSKVQSNKQREQQQAEQPAREDLQWILAPALPALLQLLPVHDDQAVVGSDQRVDTTGGAQQGDGRFGHRRKQRAGQDARQEDGRHPPGLVNQLEWNAEQQGQRRVEHDVVPANVQQHVGDAVPLGPAVQLGQVHQESHPDANQDERHKDWRRPAVVELQVGLARHRLPGRLVVLAHLALFARRCRRCAANQAVEKAPTLRHLAPLPVSHEAEELRPGDPSVLVGVDPRHQVGQLPVAQQVLPGEQLQESPVGHPACGRVGREHRLVGGRQPGPVLVLVGQSCRGRLRLRRLVQPARVPLRARRRFGEVAGVDVSSLPGAGAVHGCRVPQIRAEPPCFLSQSVSRAATKAPKQSTIRLTNSWRPCWTQSTAKAPAMAKSATILPQWTPPLHSCSANMAKVRRTTSSECMVMLSCLCTFLYRSGYIASSCSPTSRSSWLAGPPSVTAAADRSESASFWVSRPLRCSRWQMYARHRRRPSSASSSWLGPSSASPAWVAAPSAAPPELPGKWRPSAERRSMSTPPRQPRGHGVLQPPGAAPGAGPVAVHEGAVGLQQFPPLALPDDLHVGRQAGDFPARVRVVGSGGGRLRLRGSTAAMKAASSSGATVSLAVKHLASLRGLTVLLLLYTCLGAGVMMQLENSQLPHKRRGLQVEDVDRNFLYKLYEIRTSKLVSREDFVAASKKQIAKRFGRRWSGASTALDFLYCFTLYTTIGYGHAHPVSAAGKLFSLLYSVLGIPLFLVFAGRLSARLQRWLSSKLPSALLAGKRTSEGGGDSLPLWTSAVLLTAHSLAGGVLYAATEDWPVGDGAYFSLVSVSSVGLGDLTPGLDSRAKLGACLLHLTLGIGLCGLLMDRLNSWLDSALQEAAATEDHKGKAE